MILLSVVKRKRRFFSLYFIFPFNTSFFLIKRKTDAAEQGGGGTVMCGIKVGWVKVDFV